MYIHGNFNYLGVPGMDWMSDKGVIRIPQYTLPYTQYPQVPKNITRASSFRIPPIYNIPHPKYSSTSPFVPFCIAFLNPEITLNIFTIKVTQRNKVFC